MAVHILRSVYIYLLNVVNSLVPRITSVVFTPCHCLDKSSPLKITITGVSSQS